MSVGKDQVIESLGEMIGTYKQVVEALGQENQRLRDENESLKAALEASTDDE